MSLAKSILVWRCQHCGETEMEPHELAEPELRAALDAGEVRAMRLHSCRTGQLAASVVIAVRPTLVGALERFA